MAQHAPAPKSERTAKRGAAGLGMRFFRNGHPLRHLGQNVRECTSVPEV